MDEQNSQTRMDQRIFELGLPVETVSVYLLCIGLSESGKDLTFDTLASVWNGSGDSLVRELKILEEKNIIGLVSDDPDRYRVHPSEIWI